MTSAKTLLPCQIPLWSSRWTWNLRGCYWIQHSPFISLSLQLLILFKTLPKIAPKAFCIYCASFAYFFHNAPTVMLQKYITYLFSPNLWNHREQGEWLIKVSGSCKSLLINPGRKEDRKNEREVCGHSLEHSSKVNILLVQFLVIKT